MTAERQSFAEAFKAMPPETQESFHRMARNSILQLPKCPMDYRVVEELMAWQQVEIDVMEAHAAWLSKTRAKFERRGVEWNDVNLHRYSRLWECE